MYHHNSSTVAHTPSIFQDQSSVDDEDTSLYSPLPIARPEGNDNDGVNVTGTTTKHHTSDTNEEKTNAANTKANHIKQGSSMNLNSCRTDRKSIITLRQNETDEDYEEDDDEEGDEVGYLENGTKKHAAVSIFLS